MRPQEVRTPRNASETRKALRIGRPGVYREVYLDSKVHNARRSRDVLAALDADNFEVDVHPNSRLVVYVYSGIPFLKLVRGGSANVYFNFQSSWGNSLDIFEGQGAHVTVLYPETKVTIKGDESDLKLDLPEGDKHRVYWPSKYPPLGAL